MESEEDLAARLTERLPIEEAEECLCQLEEHCITVGVLGEADAQDLADELGFTERQCDAVLLDDEAWQARYSQVLVCPSLPRTSSQITGPAQSQPLAPLVVAVRTLLKQDKTKKTHLPPLPFLSRTHTQPLSHSLIESPPRPPPGSLLSLTHMCRRYQKEPLSLYRRLCAHRKSNLRKWRPGTRTHGHAHTRERARAHTHDESNRPKTAPRCGRRKMD